MTHVHFTSHLQKHLDCPTQQANGCTVREILDAVFAKHPRLRGYILDDQSRLRQHVVIFVDDVTVRDRDDLSDVVTADSHVYVLQALSGG